MQNKNDVYFSSKIEYDKTDDNDLVNLANSGDSRALETIIKKYNDVVNMKVSKYYINGAEKDDIIQEGLIGLYKAVKNYNSDKENSFKSFANLCIERQIITYVKGANRQKHIPLNSYISLNNTSYQNEDGEEDNQLIDIFNANTIDDPLEIIAKNEYYELMEKAINNSLSDFEKEVLNRYMEGKSYEEIAKSLNSQVKSVDNAIQRIRKKTSKTIDNME